MEITPIIKDRRKKSLHKSFRDFVSFRGTGKGVKEFLGNDLAGLREWIESNFTEGMSWDNYGKIWVIDHIVPVRMFNIFDEKDLKICWHYKNLMPLFKEDNLKKEGNVFFAYELLLELKDKDYYYQKLYERILPEVKWMAKYIETFHKKYKPKNK